MTEQKKSKGGDAMTKEESAKYIKGCVTDYQNQTGRKVYLQKYDYFYYLGALTYAKNSTDIQMITADIQSKLVLAREPENRPNMPF